MSAPQTDSAVINWPEADAQFFNDWSAYDPSRVHKIVLGSSPGSDKTLIGLKVDELLKELPRFNQVTHLYLWNISGLKSLPLLPAGLQCLDVRGCKELTELSFLPETLDTLDLGGCAGLAKLAPEPLPAMERFYFNGCTKLKAHHVAGFLEANRESSLLEIDGSGAPGVTSLAEFPRTGLRKLVLKGCTALANANGIAEFAALHHLNLAGCTALTSLPDLPPKLQYLELYGATHLKTFMGQSLAPAELGTKDGPRQNVAKTFRTLKKFGVQLKVMPHAKLLLLGDGRVGKTTLAKRLIWSELTEEQRRIPTNAHLRPVQNQRYTNSVEFFRWPTQLSLPAKKGGNEEAQPPRVENGDVRIWDFGGQEIYHRTHRIFAGEGSVFLIVWCPEPLTTMERPPGVLLSEEVWKEVNATKSLDYWFDYVATMKVEGREIPEVALVCTLPQGRKLPPGATDWKERAPKHKESASKTPEAFCLDTLDDRCATTGEYRRLQTWIREKCGAQAETIGLEKPAFYNAVARLIDGWLEENSRARATGGQPPHLLRSADRWHEDILAMYSREFPGHDIVPDADDIAAITDYLHDTGHLFRLRSTGGDVILVDQQWAAGVIYSLLDIQSPLWPRVREQGGYFTRDQLEIQPAWQSLKDDVQRERMLKYMLDCGIVVQLAAADRSASGQEVFLAADKWLLPPRTDVETRIHASMDAIEAQHEMTPFEAFDFENVELNEFEFRALQALLAREFGTGAIYFREGLFAQQSPDWCFLLTWGPKAPTKPEHSGSTQHHGYLGGRLLAHTVHAERLARRITDIFYSSTSPLGQRSKNATRRTANDYDLRQVRFSLRPDQYLAGLSSSGKDKAEAMEIYRALGGFAVDFYAEKRPQQERLGVFDYMKQMVSQPCIVLLLSEDFVRYDPESWHCAWELADAVCRLADGRRSGERTIVLYKNSQSFHSRNAETIVRELFTKLSAHFSEQYRKGISESPPERWGAFEDDKHFAGHFAKAAGNCAAFFALRTTKGDYLKAVPAGSGAAYPELVQALKVALGEVAES